MPRHTPSSPETTADAALSRGEAASAAPAADAAEKAGRSAPRSGLSRRGLLGLLGAGAGGLALGAAGGLALRGGAEASGAAGPVHPFFGARQAGITTAVQDHLHFAAFDLTPSATRDDLIELLQDWSYAASRITQGLDVSASGAVGGSPEAPPDDTGEALGLPASALTVTFGLGPGVFEKDGVDRFRLAARRPADLADLPAFLGDDLDPLRSGGDLCIQACADDPQVAVHAIRNLTRIAFGRARLRWSQLGFGRTSRTTSAQPTPRNLFGFKDGTANLLADDEGALAEHVWVGEEGPGWLAGGSYLMVRRIRQKNETWDRLRLIEQERIIGRDKGDGAPLSGGTEFTDPDFAAASARATPAIDPDSHVRMAHPDSNDGIRMLRRGFNFVDGNDALGALDAGLFFLAFQRSPMRFIPVQRQVSRDLLTEYLVTTGSAVFAIPPGAEAGSFVGAGLFD